MNTFYLNVGLWHRGTQDEMMLTAAMAAVEARVFKILRVALVRRAGEEPSLVIHASTFAARSECRAMVWDAAKVLGQDCIALYWEPTKEGSLDGPGCTKWAPFDLKLFNFL